ncbi:MAG: hypothetical protein N3E39_00770 [Candidatus Methanomethylicia archaeon]|nr:hypothetical protein [Candidatus Methanomethylicia archaeon]
MFFQSVFKHYSIENVIKEILDYCSNRWVAVEAKGDDGKRIFFRYWRKNESPLSFKNLHSYMEFLNSHRVFNIRSFYASINIYNSLEVYRDVSNLNNIAKCTPILDIDGSLNNVKLTLDVAKVILEFLDSKDVYKSVYLKWSGRGLHIHINENAISKDILSKIHPLDAAYAVVEYVISECWGKIKDLISKTSNFDREFKVENKIDIQRVFTCPLSLHRDYNIVAVCFKPNEIDNFDLSWTNPLSFKHNLDWRVYVEGEVDQLVLEAYKNIGGYIAKMSKSVKFHDRGKTLLTIISEIPSIHGRIGRFQVMALLQSARYYVLRGDLDRAKSFGLNRAIFYAWAKYYKSKYGFSRKSSSINAEKFYSSDALGDEKVFVSSNGYYIIGDMKQTPSDFDREIASKINSVVSFDIAWEAALDYVKRFPKKVLESQHEFYKKVYEPVRDEFSRIIQEYLAFKKLGEKGLLK